jgi:formylglycine-generating enzyme required for sulfatase activity
VFLSYSHDSEAHRAWVRELAERLVQGGVEVSLDQWDLRPGGDVVRFMDLGIRDADRVLMVCTANYVAKAEERKGGAGYEGMIVTGHVARATDTIKFVPIVRDHAGETLVPRFLGQRLWLDFRNDGLFEERLEELLRELHGAPRYPKPPLGRNPFAGPEPEGAKAAPGGPSAPASPPPMALSPLTVPSALLRRDGVQWQVDRQDVRVQACEVALGEGESLRLIQIQEGKFEMGSPADEIDRYSVEGPLHRVSLAGYLLGQTPVTQAQWAAVARWPRVEQDLKSDPSHFKGARRPVEQVSWEQAMEFCRRLSQRTGLPFTLPSEAQWEYACRASTTTPFAFGATLTSELANYEATISYEGRYRGETTEVPSFPANGWGLNDMHGNVWEWCLDTCHDSFEGAPTDGSPWLGGGSSKLLRGGSWYDSPGFCRSAYRSHFGPGGADYGIGFRVVFLPQGPSLNA